MCPRLKKFRFGWMHYRVNYPRLSLKTFVLATLLQLWIRPHLVGKLFVYLLSYIRQPSRPSIRQTDRPIIVIILTCPTFHLIINPCSKYNARCKSDFETSGKIKPWINICEVFEKKIHIFSLSWKIVNLPVQSGTLKISWRYEKKVNYLPLYSFKIAYYQI